MSIENVNHTASRGLYIHATTNLLHISSQFVNSREHLVASMLEGAVNNSKLRVLLLVRCVMSREPNEWGTLVARGDLDISNYWQGALGWDWR